MVVILPGPLGPKTNKPLVENDEGPLMAGLKKINSPAGIILDFGKTVTFVLIPPQDAKSIAKVLRNRVYEWFGPMNYDVNGLSPHIVVTSLVERNLVRIDFGITSGVPVQGILAANPEVYLAIAQRLDEEAAKLKIDPNAINMNQ